MLNTNLLHAHKWGINSQHSLATTSGQASKWIENDTGLDHVKTHLDAACWLLKQSLRLHMALNKKIRHIISH